MTTKADDSYHRQWLHAMEDDRSVPGTAMQVGRILADYSASRRDGTVSVSWTTLQRQTHRSRDAIDQAMKYLIGHGWLVSYHRGNGQRSTYSLTFGEPGTPRKPVRLPDRSESQDQSGYRTGRGHKTSPATGPVEVTRPVRLPDRHQSDSRTATSPAIGPRTSTSVTSLSKGLGPLHAALSAVVPDVTERETQLALDEIKNQPGIRSATAVMRTEIQNGTIADRIAKIRRAANLAQTTTTLPPFCGQCDNRMIEDDQGRLMHCPNCHPAAIAKAGEPQPI